MKNLFLLLIALFALCTTAQAASPREQLNQLVAELQKNPGDNALREKIIKLVQEIKPAPAIPEEARRHFVKATVLQKEAKTVDDYGQPIEEYRQALAIAPWWGDAYFNLSVALESAGKLDESKNNLKLYLLTNPAEKDARDAQDRIYALEAKQEKLAKEKAGEEAKYGWLLGQWKVHFGWSGTQMEYYQTAHASKKGNQVVLGAIGERTGTYPNGEKFTATVTSDLLRATLMESGNIEWQYNYGLGKYNCPAQNGWQNINAVVSSDRRTVSFAVTPLLVGKCTPSGSGTWEWTFTRQ